MDTARLKEQFELRLREQIHEHANVLQYPRRFAELVERDGAIITADNVFNDGIAAGKPAIPHSNALGKPSGSTSPSNGWCGPNRAGSRCSARPSSATSSNSPRT